MPPSVSVIAFFPVASSSPGMFRKRCPWMRIPFSSPSSSAAAEGVPAGDSGTLVLTPLGVGGP
eukprot:3687295-Amphidinium_carterae.1